MKMNRTFKHWWQRRTRGWDDSETWDLDVTLARLIAPRLRRFLEVSNGIPISYFEFDDGKQVTPDEAALTAWHSDLAKMLKAFDRIAKMPWADDVESPEVTEGLELFAKHFRELGW